MKPPPSSMFPEDGDAPADGRVPALEYEDMARMLRVVGVQSVRASVVDLASRAFQAGLSISDDGVVVERRGDRGLDSLFPGAASALDHLTQGSVEQARLQKLSPRRWVVAWRIDAVLAVIAEAQYRDRRDAVGDIDTAVLRLVCNASIRSSLAAREAAALPGGDDTPPVLVWPQVERRAIKPPARSWLALFVLQVFCASMSAWVALVGVPGAQRGLAQEKAQNAQLRKTTDATLAQRVSNAMATGDYGEAQTELASFSSLGYFQRAVVTNANGKVVAMVGDAAGVRIGDLVDPAFAAAAGKLDLVLGSVRHGQLLIVTRTPPAAASLLGLRITAALTFVAALAGAVTVGLLLPRRWR
jgi:hypothetical protein